MQLLFDIIKWHYFETSEPAIEDVTTETTTQTLYDPCYYHYVIESDVTRSVNYTLQPWEEEQCDTTNITEGWYRYEGYQNVPNYSPSSGQCGSSSPIWFRGYLCFVHAEMWLYLLMCNIESNQHRILTLVFFLSIFDASN